MKFGQNIMLTKQNGDGLMILSSQLSSNDTNQIINSKVTKESKAIKSKVF